MPSLNVDSYNYRDNGANKSVVSPRFLSPRFFKQKREEADMNKLAEQMAAERASTTAPSGTESERVNHTDGEVYGAIKKRKWIKSNKKVDKMLEAVIESSKDKPTSSSEKSGKSKKSKNPKFINEDLEEDDGEKEILPQSDKEKPPAANESVIVEKSEDYERDDESSSSMAPKKIKKHVPDSNLAPDSDDELKDEKASLESQESSSMDPKRKAKRRRAKSIS